MTIRSSETYEDDMLFWMKKQISKVEITKKYWIFVDIYYTNTIHKINNTDENILDKISIRVYDRKLVKFLSGRTIYSDGRIISSLEDGEESY